MADVQHGLLQACENRAVQQIIHDISRCQKKIHLLTPDIKYAFAMLDLSAFCLYSLKCSFNKSQMALDTISVTD